MPLHTHGRTYPNDFFRFNKPGYPHPIGSELENNKCQLISDWRSVIAMSLNVGGGVRLIKLAKLYMCMQNHFKQNGQSYTVQMKIAESVSLSLFMINHKMSHVPEGHTCRETNFQFSIFFYLRSDPIAKGNVSLRKV